MGMEGFGIGGIGSMGGIPSDDCAAHLKGPVHIPDVVKPLVLSEQGHKCMLAPGIQGGLVLGIMPQGHCIKTGTHIASAAEPAASMCAGAYTDHAIHPARRRPNNKAPFLKRARDMRASISFYDITLPTVQIVRVRTPSLLLDDELRGGALQDAQQAVRLAGQSVHS